MSSPVIKPPPARPMRLLPLVVSAFLLAAAAHAQPDAHTRPELLTDEWPAAWIVHPDADPFGYGVYHYRKAFELEAVPDAFVVHASADNRYRLFVNGTRVGHGPARGDLRNWHYETYDLAPHLRPGTNVVAALVWNAGEHRPMEQITHRTGFVLQGNADAEAVVDTDETWRVHKSEAYAPVAFRDNDARLLYQYYIGGALDSLDAARHPWGWEGLSYDDEGWARAEVLDRAAPAGWESHQKWALVLRSVPPLRERPQRFARIRRTEGVRVPAAFLTGEADLVIPPHTTASVLLDQGAVTTGYPALVFSGGAGGTVRLRYAEALYDSLDQKGHRDDIEDKRIVGVYDVVRPGDAAGGPERTFRPLWVRSWRYVQLDVETGAEPLVLHDVYSHEVTYPAERVATFEAGRDTLEAIWELGWRTLLLNAQETFVSDLSWERIQYVGDTKVQALAWLYLTDDEALVKQAIRQFDASRLPSGLTQSRYPSDLEQVTPLYSLAWVTMVHDYWMLRRDRAFVEEMLPGIATVLGWFERRRGADGLIEMSSHDFRNRGYRRWRAERYPGVEGERMTLHSLFYALALQQAADLYAHFGRDADAARYLQQAAELIETVRACCFDAERGALADSPEGRVFTLPPQIFGVLTGAVPEGSRRPLLEAVVEGAYSDLPQGRYFFYHLFLGEALAQEGLGHRYLDTLEPWRRMVGQGLTTLAEEPENARSDAHPWTTDPLYAFLATTAGVRPSAPGFESVRIAPALGPLSRLQATVPHPNGLIEVAFEREGDGLIGVVQLPPGTAGTIEWGGQAQPLREGRQAVKL